MPVIEKRVNGKTTERFEDSAIWKQMYFGHPRAPVVELGASRLKTTDADL